MEKYPNYLWRGIAAPEYVSQGQVLYNAFQFEDFDREDHFLELSINWDDDEEALEKILTQRKENGKLQFKIGAAKLSLSMTKMILKDFYDNHQFDHERNIEPDNKYHGNLLVASSVEKQLRTKISNGLALVAGSNIVYQNDE